MVDVMSCSHSMTSGGTIEDLIECISSELVHSTTTDVSNTYSVK